MAGPTTADRGARKPNGQRPSSPSSGSGKPGKPSRSGSGSGGSGQPGRSGRAPGRSPSRVFRLRMLLAVSALVVLSGAGIWLLYGSSWLRIEEVRVAGTTVLTPREVERAAAVPVGSPLVSVDLDGIEARLRQEMPRIDSVEAVRSWPRGVELTVVERKPVLLVEEGGKFVELDAKGVRFATVDTPPKGLPLLEATGLQPSSLRRFGEQRLVREAVRATSGLPPGAARALRSVEIRSYDFITMKLTQGRTVMWGSGDDGEAKARALAALLKAQPDARYFDVSAPTAPAASGS
ncbi:cell division protein FtsQ/DivIB [Streptomyces sp. NPDC059828]|uniref:cell division protein FtsQ/DivIB n=1 Tax=Streptomyces sp. NPDC059828 TaxID=3346965 RepID=UPI003668F873